MKPRRRQAGDSSADLPDWRHLLSVGLPLGCVIGALVLGASLRVDADSRSGLTFAGPSEGTGATETTETLEPPAPQLPESEPAPSAARIDAPAAPAGADPLAQRGAEDLERVGRAPDRWTSQLALLCDEIGARRLMQRFPDTRDLYLLPVEHGGRACWTVSWGLYDRIDAARAPRDLPRALRADHPNPFPKQVAAILQERR